MNLHVLLFQLDWSSHEQVISDNQIIDIELTGQGMEVIDLDVDDH